MSVRIITNSASDISQAEANQLGIDVLPTTSQLSPFDYEQKFREAVERGDEVVCIALSSKLSGCYQSASIAAKEFPGKIVVVDSKSVAIGERILVQIALKARDEGKSAPEIGALLETHIQKLRLIALVDTLEYLKRGGRVSSAAAFAGTLLGIKPVIAVEDGAVSILGKARGSKNGSNMLMTLVEKNGGINFDLPFALAYSGLDDSLLQKYIADSASLYQGKAAHLPVYTIGSTIGTHVGPGAIAVAFFSNN